ncbi:hypothetical protein ACFLSX_05470, partial [Calditrichota bacterium]
GTGKTTMAKALVEYLQQRTGLKFNIYLDHPLKHNNIRDRDEILQLDKNGTKYTETKFVSDTSSVINNSEANFIIVEEVNRITHHDQNYYMDFIENRGFFLPQQNKFIALPEGSKIIGTQNPSGKGVYADHEGNESRTIVFSMPRPKTETAVKQLHQGIKIKTQNNKLPMFKREISSDIVSVLTKSFFEIRDVIRDSLNPKIERDLREVDKFCEVYVNADTESLAYEITVEYLEKQYGKFEDYGITNRVEAAKWAIERVFLR